jgi:hypothetical protein
MPIAFPSKFAKEGVAVGRLLTSYSILEIDLMNCVQMGRGGDLNTVLKAMYGKRGANARIDEAEKLGVTSYSALGLAGDFGTAISAFRYCLKIRNQFAHWIWWDDLTGQVAFADLEELAKQKKSDYRSSQTSRVSRYAKPIERPEHLLRLRGAISSLAKLRRKSSVGQAVHQPG